VSIARRPPIALLGVLVLAAWPFVFSSPYDLRVFGLAGIYAILVLGYQFIFGHAGAFALTQGMFFGLAAYITAILGARLGWPPEASLPVAVIAPVVAAALVALPVLRLETHYFALATLGLAQVALLLAIKWEALTGGANGIAGVPPLSVLGSAVPNGLPMIAIIWGAVAICGWLSWQAMRGVYGRIFHVMRDNPLVAGAIGIDAARLRFAAFIAGAAYAGLAGALHAHMLRVVSPEVLEFHVMVACLSMAVVGGRNRVAGAIIGAVLLVHLPEWLRGFESAYLIVYGAVLLATIIAAPDGIAGMIEKVMPARRAASVVPADLLQIEAPSSGPLLALKGVSKHFGGVDALRDVTFAIRTGEIVGLIGPNGSGKTTLLNVVSGLYAAESGEIVLGGERIDRLRPFEIARRGIGRSFQRIILIDDMQAVDNVAVACATRSDASVSSRIFSTAPLAIARAQALSLLSQLGAMPHAWDAAGVLPQGIRRRVEIARALAAAPRLLLLDEPAAGLGPAEAADLSARLRTLAGQGLAILIVEHDMSFLFPLAERVVCLDAGSVLAIGTPDVVSRDPAVRRAYLGVRP
jgi:branched-chain amino acid transport system permease protein